MRGQVCHSSVIMLASHSVMYTSFQTVTIYKVSFIKYTLCTRPHVNSGFGKQNIPKATILRVLWTLVAIFFNEVENVFSDGCCFNFWRRSIELCYNLLYDNSDSACHPERCCLYQEPGLTDLESVVQLTLLLYGNECVTHPFLLSQLQSKLYCHIY